MNKEYRISVIRFSYFTISNDYKFLANTLKPFMIIYKYEQDGY